VVVPEEGWRELEGRQAKSEIREVEDRRCYTACTKTIGYVRACVCVCMCVCVCVHAACRREVCACGETQEQHARFKELVIVSFLCNVFLQLGRNLCCLVQSLCHHVASHHSLYVVQRAIPNM
jgi:hypothetical protein